MRPILRPGLHILRRDIRTLQLGAEWPAVAAVEARPSVTTVLACVDGFRDARGVALASQAQGIAPLEAGEAVSALIGAGVLVDQAVVCPPDVPEPTWAAMWLLAGPEQTARTVLESRRRTSVAVLGTGEIADVV